MPQWFRENGFFTVGSGKLFHPALPPNFDVPHSWQRMYYPGCNTGEKMNGWDVADPNVTTLTCLAQSGCEAQAIVAGDSDPANQTWCSLNTSLLKNPLGDDLVLSSGIKLLQEAAENLKGPTPRPFFVGTCQQPAVCHVSPSGSASVLTWRAARTVLVQVSGFTSLTCRGIFRLSLGTFTMWRTSNRQSTRTHRKGCRSWRGTNPGLF